MAEPHQSPGLSSSLHSRNSIPATVLQPSTRLRLRLTGLPPRTSTLDIYENLCRYGTIVKINLFETREGFKSTKAEVDYQPAPSQTFWTSSLHFETRSHHSAEVRFQIVDRLPQVFTKESPLRKGVIYNDRTVLDGKALDFGVLTGPTKMMLMGRAESIQHKPILILDLHRRQMEFHFPWQQISSNRSAVRVFRFNIALDADVKVWQLPDVSFVLHVPKAPWYSKQLAEAVANTHSPDARTWTIEDTWARQTDLWTYKQNIPEINSSPVTLAKHLNDINIFRWTTFRFHPAKNDTNEFAVKTFVNALRDWNVKVQVGDEFEIIEAEPGIDKKVWNLINAAPSNHASPSPMELPHTQLPFAVRYQLEVCLSHGWFSEYSITPRFLERLSEMPEIRAQQALLYVALDQKRLFDPMVIFKDIHYAKPVRAKRLPDNCIEIRSATVTATGILFNTPAVEITNRIIRNHKSHAHRFLRVRFEDDDYRGQTRIFPSTNNKMVMIFMRVKRALTYGIRLGDVLYEFLAWGNSQLREHGAYFFAASGDLTADSIRAEMGHFQETVVAKKAARMGQCFSTTRPVNLPMDEIREIDVMPDIVRNGYTFTDGVGKISPLAAELVATQLQIKGPTPCLFQFRLGGCKGVLAVSNDLSGVGVRIRKSQLKFKSLAKELEINRYAQFWQACLNRQIILCLSSLGVPTEVFIRRQAETITTLNQAMCDDNVAINTLRSTVDPNMMTLELSRLVEAGFRKSREPFVIALLELWRAWSLKYLKEKARIPVEEGAFVLGSVDETASLQGHTSACPSGPSDIIVADAGALNKLPEIFLQITDHKTGGRRIIEGICILARNPSLHRGDIRIVRARNVVALHHMCDVVVMPQLGDRDLPSMCSGGDLDGDDYIVIWAQDLIPSFWNAEPFHYDPPIPKTTAGEIKTSDLVQFFHDYMQNDALGKIAVAHMAAADFFDDGLENRICLELVQLHSMAVDYPKTGIPAKMERRLERPDKPHFMEPLNKPYRSHKVLGRLYDEINKFYKKLQKDTFAKHDLDFDERILKSYHPDIELLRKVEGVKEAYDISLGRMLTQHKIRTEFELWSTFVLEHSKKSRDYKFHEEVGELSRVLKEEYYEELCDLAGGRDFNHLAPVAVAAYKVTHEQSQTAKSQAQSRSDDECESYEMPYISFPWVLQETLIKIAAQINLSDRETSEEGEKITKNAIDPVENTPVADELYDVVNLQLGRDELSPYLPDPARNSGDSEFVRVVENQHRDPSELHHSRGPDHYDPLQCFDKTVAPVPEKCVEDAAERSSWDVVSHPPEGGSQFSFIEDQPRSGPSASDEGLSQSVQRDPSKQKPRSPDQVITVAKQISAYKPHAVHFKANSDRRATCFYWKMPSKTCKYSAEECKHAHYDTGIDMQEKEQVTCYFWLHGDKCNLDEAGCKFAHHDTGYHAPRPQGTSPVKARDGARTVRVLAESSESDDEEMHSIPSRRTPRSPSVVDAGPTRRQEQDERHTTQPQLHTDRNRVMANSQQDMNFLPSIANFTGARCPKEDRTAVYVNDALEIHGVVRESDTSSSPHRVRSEPNAFNAESSARSTAFPAHSLPRTKPVNHLTPIADERYVNKCLPRRHKEPELQPRSQKVDTTKSWLEELEGLVFNDTTVTVPKLGVTEGDEYSTSARPRSTPFHEDPIRVPERGSQSQCPITDQIGLSHSGILIEDTYYNRTPPPHLVHVFDHPNGPEFVSASQHADTFSPADYSTSSGHITTNERSAFGDPLASDDADNDPEIDELFD